MAKSIKMRAKMSGDETTVKALLTHPMETGLRKGKDGKKIPAHHITEVTCEHGGKVVMTALWGPAVSLRPSNDTIDPPPAATVTTSTMGVRSGTPSTVVSASPRTRSEKRPVQDTSCR